MNFKIDHDLHIHSTLSECAKDPEQTTEAILSYAKKNGLSRIMLTDHYWDASVPGASDWYKPQDFEHIEKALPLPSAPGITFGFGCETDLRKDLTLGIPKERFDDFDFVIIPATHLHMNGFTIAHEDIASNARRAELWVSRFDALLSMDLPFHKTGIAHPACCLIAPKSHADFLEVLSLIPSSEMERLFSIAAKVGCGIELNQADMSFPDSETDTVLRMFRIAKSCGCKFYLGSDSHDHNYFKKTVPVFERAINLLGLTENDKFIPKS